ncbi:hypothetical protein B2J93_3536 [Marssonina coronariae]|uniref:Heme haloperoxidase family profile domain-containing protein n=1 Tax=Diplocarpon coronariae TaxID=2795749 RepID=A0A218Z6Z2_9HELO|nr:hypothetical protein B2J93_3536 [Marssonina coronariae]
MEMNEQLHKRIDPAPWVPLFLFKRTNTGIPTLTFDPAEQFVNTGAGSGHELTPQLDRSSRAVSRSKRSGEPWLSASECQDKHRTDDYRLRVAYGISPELAFTLSVISVALPGDPLYENFPATLPLVGGHPFAIIGTHDQYESDASIIRWEHLWNLGPEGYNYDSIAAQSDYVTRWSKENNPYFFQAAFANAVSPAAHNFIRFMSTHSAEAPGGVLTCEMLKSFFAVSGDASGSFVHNIGQERIPDNWYRRPSSNPCMPAQVVPDVLADITIYPGIFEAGGNTGKVHSYVGVVTGDLTGGLFNATNLLEGNYLLGAVGSVLGYVKQQLGPVGEKLGCPQLAPFNNPLYNKFPGASYEAQGR